jgi:type IV pilus assembly protein PilE
MISNRKRMMTMQIDQEKRQRGFTLIEVMIVVAIIALLVMIAMPSYQSYVRKTQRSMAKSELLSVMARQEQFFTDNKQYATDLTSLGYVASPYAINRDGEDLETTATGIIYEIGLSSASSTAYTLQAVPQGDQANDSLCMTLQITSAGVKSHTGSGSTSECW